MRVPRPKVPRCVKCGSSRKVEMHHLGGRHHVAWILAPLCRDHHVRLTILLQQAGVDMRYTDDEVERGRRIRKAVYVFLWFLEADQS